MNAMVHGNQGIRRQPSIANSMMAEQIDLLITDQGEGLRSIKFRDPDDEQSLLLEHGRGILLMSEWLDELSYFLKVVAPGYQGQGY